ncbi:hypothetical protein Q7P35_006482 [Cladosporium inversicolor]
MAAQNSAGIQTLLDETSCGRIRDLGYHETVARRWQEYGADIRQQAEREAQKIVQKAREYRTKRVKDAKSEAQKEIEDYRSQKESEFKSFEAEWRKFVEKLGLGTRADSEQHTSGNKKAEEDAQKATDKQLEEIKQIGEKTGPKVVDDLLKAVVTVNPEVPTRTEQPTV